MQLISEKSSRVWVAVWLIAISVVAADDPAAPAPPKGNSPIKGSFEAPGAGGSTNAISNLGSVLGLNETQQQEILGGIADKIKSLNSLSSKGLDNPLVRARFEKFLDAQESDQKEVDRYLAMIRQIRDGLKRRELRPAIL